MCYSAKTILLVEDNPDDVLLTMRAFKRNNLRFPISVVQDGVEALDFLNAQGGHCSRVGQPLPTLIILDLKLPRLDGLEVLKELRANARTKLIPVVILTSSQEERDLMLSYSLGANSYVRKPVDFAEFLEAMKVLGVYWLIVNHPPPAQEEI